MKQNCSNFTGHIFEDWLGILQIFLSIINKQECCNTEFRMIPELSNIIKTSLKYENTGICIESLGSCKNEFVGKSTNCRFSYFGPKRVSKWVLKTRIPHYL